ncbi:MAG: outer rane lipoproteinsorting protein [Nevskia sp.]|nr:outer rane lipoproteinsorting protein [Nevskia sp.]
MGIRTRGLIILQTSVAALLLLSGSVRAAPDDELHKVLDCMRGNVPPTVRIQEIELAATDRGGGARTLKGRLYAMNDKGLIRASLRIVLPQDLAGAGYLVRETSEGHGDEMYMFLPSVNRVRRISGTSADGSLLGTDFSYNDIKQLENAFDGSDPVLEKPAQIEDRPVYVLLLKTKPAQDSRYTTMRAWVDQKSCVALKVDFYEGDKIRKELTAPAAALQQAGKYWYLSQAKMSDLKENTSTTLKVLGVTSGTELPTRYFDPHSFYLGN